MIALALLLACGRADPELVAQRDAIAAWAEGKAALEAGDPRTARAHFARARALRPRDGLLAGWEARAAAEAGDLDQAIALAREALEAQPGMAAVRYNLAAWMARAGDPGSAARELARALEDGASTPEAAASDPDFAPYLDQPAFGFLPRQALEVSLDLPDAAVFWGSQATIRLAVRGGSAPEIAGGLTGPVELVRGVSTEVEGGLRQEWQVVVRGQGRVEVGPLTVRLGERSAEVAPAGFDALAPPDRPPAPRRTLALSTTARIRADLDRAWAGGPEPGPPAAGDEVRVAALPGQVLAMGGLTHRARLEPEAGRLQRFEHHGLDGSGYRIHRWVELPPGPYAVVWIEGGDERRVELRVPAASVPPG